MRLRNLIPQSVFGFFIQVTLVSTSFAHFPWLAIDAEGKVLYYFGETVAQRDYKLPEKIASAEIQAVEMDGSLKPLEMQTIDGHGFIGRQSLATVGQVKRIQSNVTYGIHGGSRLDYYTSHIPGTLPKSFDFYTSQLNDSDFQCFGIDTETGVTIRVLWKGKPQSDTEVKLFCEDGDEEANKKTNDAGEVQFSDGMVEEGLNAVLVGFTHKDEAGKLGDREYKSASHYLTMTFNDPESPVKPLKPVVKTSQSSAPIVTPAATTKSVVNIHGEKLHADLPLPLTSFGAVRHGETLFVYGGHTGEAHHYSSKEQSDSLFALDLRSNQSEWKELAKGRRLQGLGLVAHSDSIIRVGGFEAVNGVEDEADLRSSEEVMAFNLKSNTWSTLPSLPEPRSSHDALIVGNRLYVVGGWTLRGAEKNWLSTAWSIELPAEGKSWEALPTPSFTRRAIALASVDGRLYAIGGMNEKGGPTTEVAFLDIEARTWNPAPSLSGKPMNGFGVAAWNDGNTIIATTSEGDIQRLAPDGKEWEVVGKTHDARFFHRLLPYGDGRFVALGGANMEQHLKFPNLEVISIR